ncbi:hypothetical protein DFH09DRAFT_910769 [Mycena vulgaris]|nr:hypothetical protein DFH09DRAFT_910769 [Mycena vulgaris]
MSHGNTPKPIQIQHAIHPGNAAHFKALAASSKDIRTARSGVHTICTTCLKSEGPGLDLRRCGKCKGAWYCSRECQKQDWPKHKKSCTLVDGSGMMKLVETLFSIPLVNLYLQACLILDFDLLRRPHLDRPFMARVDIAIEPANAVDFCNIFLGQDTPGEQIMGMVQVNGFTPATPVLMADLTSTRQDIWREARESANKEGRRSESVGLVEIANAGDSEMTITFPVYIQRGAIQMVEQSAPFEQISAITGKQASRPFSVETCMEFINMHIRADKKNQLLLRTEMRPSDIQTIRDAAVNSDNLPARILKEKLAREQIFKSLVAGRFH